MVVEDVEMAGPVGVPNSTEFNGGRETPCLGASPSLKITMQNEIPITGLI